MHRWFAPALAFALCASLTNCHCPGGGSDGGICTDIGGAGGTLTAPQLKVTFPPNALSDTVTFCVYVQSNGNAPDPDRLLVSNVYRIEPQATNFTQAATVAITYFANQVPAGVLSAAIDIRQTTPNAGTTVLPNSLVEDATSTVTASAQQAGVFWATSPIGPQPASIRVCAALPTGCSPSALIQQGQTQKYTAEVRDQAGRLMPGQAVTWSVGTASVASIDPNGIATGLGPGTSSVVATIKSISGSASLAVEGTVPPAAYPRFENPVPQGNDVLSIHRFNGNIVLTAQGGTLVTQTATGWKQLHSATGVVLNDVGSTGGAQLAAVGVLAQSGLVVLSDGVTYGGTELAFAGAAPRYLWSSASSAMAVGGGTNLLLFETATGDGGGTDAGASTDGGTGTAAQWSAIPDPVSENLLAVEGNDGGFLVVGERGSVYQYNASPGSWTAIARAPLTERLTSATVQNGTAWGTSGAQLEKYSAGGWAADTLPPAPAMGSLTNVASGGTSLALLGTTALGNQAEVLVRDPTGAWAAAALPTQAQPLSLGATSSTDVLVGGKDGQVYVYDGTSFRELSTGRTLDVHGIYTTGTDAFAVTGICPTTDPTCATFAPQGIVLRRDAATGTWSALGQPLPGPPLAVAARSASEVYVVGASALAYKWNGTTWTTIPADTSSDLLVVQICGSQVIAVGNGAVEAYNGTQFLAVPGATALPRIAALWCKDASTMLFAGDYFLASFNGTTVTQLDPSKDNINPLQWRGIWSPDGVQFVTCGVALGAAAQYFVAYDGSHFTFVNQPAGLLNMLGCNAMWGSGPGDVYAAGSLQDGTGFLVRFDGALWKRLNPGTNGPVLSISGTDATSDVYFAGTKGAIIRSTRQ